MGLKYKLDDVVVLGDNVDAYKSFTPGVKVRIGELWNAGRGGEHYTIYTLGSKDSQWWVRDFEINHEATEELQKSNESGYLVQKISVENDLVSSAVNDNESKAQDNSWYENGELPPVGANIEYKLGAGPWFEATVKYVLDVLDGDEDEIVIARPNLGFEQLLTLNRHTKIRPTVPPEKIAEQERENVIQKMVSCAGERMSFRSICESLYDAGLRFVGEDK